METTTKTPDVPAKEPRVARCLTCSNEWMARDGSQKKPARCPECLSRKVKWRDECEQEARELSEPEEKAVELHAESDVEQPESPVEEEEIAGYILPDGSGAAFGTVGEPRLPIITYKPNVNPIGFVFLLGGIAFVGILMMIFRHRKERGLQNQRERQRVEEEQRRTAEAPLDLLRYRVTGSPF